MSHPHRELPTLTELVLRVIRTSGVTGLLAAYAGSRWLTRASHSRVRRDASDAELPVESLQCVTADGQRLAGWVATPPDPRGTVALFHGAYRNRKQTLGRAAFLVGVGFRCVAFDHRGHGESRGRRISFGYHEREDVQAVLRLCRSTWPDEPTMAVGISMGAAALCFAADAARDCAAVVLESLYYDIASAFASRQTEYPAWFRRLSRGVVWVTEFRLGVRLEQLAPAEYIAGLSPAPVLLLTGSADSNAPPEDVRRLQARIPGGCELSIIPDAGHLDLFETGGTCYRQVVLDFLQRGLMSRVARRAA